MARITFTGRATIGSYSSIERALIEAAMPKLIEAGEATGKQGSQNIVEEAKSRYGERKGKARSSTSLYDESGYEHEVTPKPTGIIIRWNIGGDANFKKKVGALNYGAGAHVIAPSGRALSNPQDTSRNPRGFFSRGPVVWTTSSGKFGTRFLQAGIERALAEFSTKL